MKSYFMAVAAIVSVLLFTACAKNTYYDLLVENKTGMTLTKAKVSYDGFDFTFGTLGIDCFKGYAFAGTSTDIPLHANIEWIGPDNVWQHKIVGVKSKVPSHFKKMTIIFSIEKENNVTVSWKGDAVGDKSSRQ